MEPEQTTVAWVLLALAAVAALATSMLRVVPPGHRLVATRGGIVSRVAGPGLFFRVPMADRVALVPTGPEELPLAVHDTTRDGTDVRLLATAEVLFTAPDRDRPYGDPAGPGGRAAEGVLAEKVRAHEVADLPEELSRGWRELVAAANQAARPHGIEITGIELDELDAVLTPHHAHGPH